MTKILGRKMKMEQVVKDDRMFAVTPIQLEAQADISGLKQGDLVKISGTSKGKGFQGVVKRHGFYGGPKSHGQKDRLRAPGSIGATAPQRVMPGTRMAGRTGGERVTVRNLEIIGIDTDKRILLVSGAVPGNVKGKLEITKS